jgi:pyruvate-formate lyase
MNQRIEKLKAGIRPEQYPLCIEKSRLWTESYRQTEGEPETLRRAKALANILDKITIFIEDGELIVGNGASKPMGSEITYWGGTWYQEEIDGLKEEGYVISEEDEAEVRSLNEYWEDKTFRERQELLLDEERLWPFMQSGINLPPCERGRP